MWRFGFEALDSGFHFLTTPRLKPRGTSTTLWFKSTLSQSGAFRIPPFEFPRVDLNPALLGHQPP